jgi:hypothetical protein
VQVAIGLLLDRLDDRRIAVTRVLAADSTGEIDVAPTVRICDARALRVRDDELRRRHPGSDVARAVGEDPLGRGGIGGLHRRIICAREVWGN